MPFRVGSFADDDRHVQWSGGEQGEHVRLLDEAHDDVRPHIAERVAERPDAAIAQIRLQGQTLMPNPLVRLGRRRRLDAARDRLFYRTAPLGLFRTARMRELGLRMLEGVRVGEDFEFGIRLWAQGGRIDLLRGAGAYVIGEDAAERTTLGVMTVSERLEPIVEDYRALIRDEVEVDERKLYSTDEFELGVDGASSGGGFGGPGAPPGLTLKAFVEQRQAYLLEWLATNSASPAL